VCRYAHGRREWHITYMRLPGSAQVQFTGMTLLHSNGDQFQNIGVIPDVLVESLPQQNLWGDSGSGSRPKL
jgi:C-terminal processing protease CtpA/Prc